MKIVSFNVNSIRMRLHQLQAVIDRHQPEFIGLQETKVQDHEFPLEQIKAMGYQVVFMGQKTHYGVALLSKSACINPVYGLPNDDETAQKRFIGGEFNFNGQNWLVFNGYFPQGESRDHAIKFPMKKAFYADLTEMMSSYNLSQQHVLIMGDYNIAPDDKDIGLKPENAKRWLKTGKACFLPEERQWFQRLCECGLVDGFRICHPNQDSLFSWFDYRSRGFEQEIKRGLRIDHFLVSLSLKSAVSDAGIDYDIRAMQKPSDHAPVWLELEQ